MKIVTGLCLLAALGAFVSVQAEPPEQSLEEIADKNVTDEDIREFLKQKEKYRDNPEAMKVIENIQEAVGISEDDIARVQGKNTAEPAAPSDNGAAATAVNADPGVAEQAYQNGDYETAREHYEALAAEGDGYANLMLGLMYHQGQGVDSDAAKASAYYDRAADYGEERGSELNSSLEYELSEQQKQQATEDYSELLEKQQEAGAPPAVEQEQREKYRNVIIER